MNARNHRDLTVWGKAMDLTVDTYRLSARLPSRHQFDLGSQMRRAALSIPSNIAEGNGRVHRAEYAHHVSIAHGSAFELDTHFEIALRLDFLEERDLVAPKELLDHVSRMLNRLGTRLRR